jgi:predicted CoA-binding protein
MTSTVVLGASDNPERTSYQAIERLLRHGYTVIPINPKGGQILGQNVVTALEQVQQPVDTVTMYVGPDRQDALIDTLITLGPRRIIFNPGSENPAIYYRLQQAGITVVEACTLVLLSTGQFDKAA